MKSLCINFIFVLGVLLSAFQMFALKYKVVAQEKELARLYEDIHKKVEDIHVLQAEWALLNDPERLEKIIVQQSYLKPVKPEQIVHVSEVRQWE